MAIHKKVFKKSISGKKVLGSAKAAFPKTSKKPGSFALASAIALAPKPTVRRPVPLILRELRDPQSQVGPLLAQSLGALTSGISPAGGLMRIALSSEFQKTPPTLPVTYLLEPVEPKPGEGWRKYKDRVGNALSPVMDWLKANAGMEGTPVFSAGLVQTTGNKDQIQESLKYKGFRQVELDPLVVVTMMDNVVQDIELPLRLSRRKAPNTGEGVRVAVLDSGIDLKHPWLRVADSASTCRESVDIPGVHATHVAGCLASLDPVYSGVAPGVTLLNIKVTDSFGRAQPADITRGIDAALDRDARILSLSLGFNHLPRWSLDGIGWSCADGRCQLCKAVDNVVTSDNVLVVAAAGNFHQHAESLRRRGTNFDTELTCPGQAREALTVGALTKHTFLTADISSRGPTAYGLSKPDISAPGVNITSALVARRDAAGNIVPNLTRNDLSISKSGTSMSTPLVAGAAALILQRRTIAGEDVSPAAVRNELLTLGYRKLSTPPSEVGVGRLNVSDL